MTVPLRRMPSAVVGDFGCGEARLAASVPNRVHSFDLVAANERVTACNMTEVRAGSAAQAAAATLTSGQVPLADGSLDVAVFCLSLMGTDYVDFLAEAYRVLKPSVRPHPSRRPPAPNPAARPTPPSHRANCSWQKCGAGSRRRASLGAQLRKPRRGRARRSARHAGRTRLCGSCGSLVFASPTRCVLGVGKCDGVGIDATATRRRRCPPSPTFQDARNTMFVLFDFVRDGKERPDAERARRVAALKPCVYKRR